MYTAGPAARVEALADTADLLNPTLAAGQGGLRTDKTAQVIIAAHAFMQNLRRGHYELAVNAPPATRMAAAFAELAQAI